MKKKKSASALWIKECNYVEYCVFPTSGYAIHKHEHRTSYFKSTLTSLGPAKRWKSISADRQNWKFLRFLHHQHNNIFQDLLFSSIQTRFLSTPSNTWGSYFPEVLLLTLLSYLLKYLGLSSAKLFDHAPQRSLTQRSLTNLIGSSRT